MLHDNTTQLGTPKKKVAVTRKDGCLVIRSLDNRSVVRLVIVGPAHCMYSATLGGLARRRNARGRGRSKNSYDHIRSQNFCLSCCSGSYTMQEEEECASTARGKRARYSSSFNRSCSVVGDEVTTSRQC